MAYFSPFFNKLLCKVGHFLRQIQQNWLQMQSRCIIENTSPWFSMVLSFPTNTILPLAGCNRTLVRLSRNIIRKRCYQLASQRHVDLACIHQIRHTHTSTLTLEGSTIKFTQSARKSLFTGEMIGSKFIKSQNMLMTLFRQKVTQQGKIYGFSTTVFENSAFAILRRYEVFLAETGTTRLQLQFQQSFLPMSHVMTQCHGIDPELR